MSRFSAVGTLVLFCGESGTPTRADVQLMPLPNRFIRNFQVPLELQQRGAVRQLRRLQENGHDDILHGLDGEVELRHEWHCLGQCEPVHEREDVTPGEASEGADEQEVCMEDIETGSLTRQIDFDLTCMGENITCDDIEMIDYHEELWSHCNQDPDLLYGECTLVCRFGAHATRRCTYTFDRDNKYGLSATSDGTLVWSHCALIADCDESTLVETMGLYCNRSAIELPPPEQIEATVAPEITSAATLKTTTPLPIVRVVEADDEGDGMLIGVLGAAGGVLAGGLGVFALYKVLGRKAVSTGGNNNSSDGTGHPSVVVGRPVTDPVAGAVAPPAGAAALDDKGGGAAAGTPLGGTASSAPKGS